MATKNFTQFSLKTPLLTSDYIVGYRADGTAEFKARIKDIVTLVPDSDKQTLTFNSANNNLTISSGNTVSLASLADTAFSTTSSTFLTKTEFSTTSSTFLPKTQFANLSSTFIQSNNSVKNIISLTQAEYDSIPVKDPQTVYIIV